MKGKRFSRKLAKGAFVGMLAGISIVMFDRDVRHNMVEKSKRFGRKTKHWVDGVRQDPRGFVNNVKHGLDQAAKSFKEVSNQLQEILQQIEEVRDTSTKIIQTAKGAGEEMKEVGSSLIHVPSHSDGGHEEHDQEDLHKLH